MKLSRKTQSPARPDGFRGFTLAEMLIAVGIFSLVIAAMVAVQLLGMRVYTLAGTKLVATAGGRKTLNQLRDQIRGGKIVYVGNCSSAGTNSFQLIGTNSVQAGNALIVYPTTNTTWYSVFYLNTNSTTNNLVQFNISNNAVTYTATLAQYLTNLLVFDCEDYQGNIISNEQCLDNRLLIRVTMQFSQWEYPVGYVGGVGWNAYDYYQLRTRVFRRAWN